MLSRLKKIKVDFFLIFLIFISTFLFFNNYTPGTFLSGWDTLHPEFNFQLYFQRIFSFWQYHQGLGAPASQSHIADLPRVLVLLIESVFLPTSFLRYSYFLLAIILGPVGVYLLIKYIFTAENNKNNALVIKVSAFLGGLFYLLNVGTMQHFIVPFEMFATKFALLGFVYLFTIKYLVEGKRKHLVAFSILTLFSTPMAHTGTLWYVYYFGLILFIISFYILKRSSIKGLVKKSLLILSLTLFINLFWILPNIYYGINYGKDVISSQINRLFTKEAFYFNKKYGDVKDLLLLKNFLFDWSIYNNLKESRYLLSDWSAHLASPFIQTLAFLFSIFSFTGIFIAIRKKIKILLSFLPIFLVSTIFLLSNTPIFSQVFDIVRGSNKLLGELLRFPFTKFSIYYIFILAIFFAYANEMLLSKLIDKIKKINWHTLTVFYFYSVIILILIYSAPTFRGNFISSIMRVKIPTKYFELFKYFESQQDGRVLTLPMQTLFGWNYYVWEDSGSTQVYQGAGFNWFGIKQPTLNREFDRWYPYNEEAYREFSYALYSNNKDLFETNLKKYNISYILIDENLKDLESQSSKKLQISESKTLLNSIKSLKLIKKIDNIFIYEYINSQSTLNYYAVNASEVKPSFQTNYIDQAYIDNATYFTNIINPDSKLIYPYRNILNRNQRINNNILDIKNNKYSLKLSAKLAKNDKISSPSFIENESVIKVDIYVIKGSQKEGLLFKYLLPYQNNSSPIEQLVIVNNVAQFDSLTINDSLLQIPKQLILNQTYIGEANLNTKDQNQLLLFSNNELKKLDLNEPNINPYLCDDPKQNQLFGANNTQEGFELLAQNAKVCVDIPTTNLIKNSVLKNNLLIAEFQYKIPFNSRAEFCFFDNEKKLCINKIVMFPNIHGFVTRQSVLPVKNSNISSLSLKFSFDAKDLNTYSSLFINNLKIQYPTQITSINIPIKSSWLSENVINNISLEGAFPSEKINILTKQISNEKKDCSLNKSRFIDKKIIETSQGDILEYHSIEGAICETFSFSDLSENVDYILGIESQNISGLPFKFCLEEDTTKKCVLEEELSEFKTNGIDYFIIPKYNHIGGYHLILRNISIGDVESINRIKSIKIVPFPYSYIQGIKISNSKNKVKNKIIEYPQAFEKNWLAYEVNSPLSKVFPVLFGKKLKEHVLVNNWANGWVVENNVLDKNIVFVFWPQYFEYVGFVVLILTFSSVIFWKKKT
ncbi:MAG: hypothetical protein ABH812_03010 [bacterium]